MEWAVVASWLAVWGGGDGGAGGGGEMGFDVFEESPSGGGVGRRGPCEVENEEGGSQVISVEGL
jgi:hypothetical protein